jgi:hypothetical protein
MCRSLHSSCLLANNERGWYVFRRANADFQLDLCATALVLSYNEFQAIGQLIEATLDAYIGQDMLVSIEPALTIGYCSRHGIFTMTCNWTILRFSPAELAALGQLCRQAVQAVMSSKNDAPDQSKPPLLGFTLN